MWWQILFAVLGLIVLQFLSNAAESAMQRQGALWPLAYLPALAGVAAAALILWWSARPRRVREVAA